MAGMTLKRRKPRKAASTEGPQASKDRKHRRPQALKAASFEGARLQPRREDSKKLGL
jgi:hypothetical protein